MLVYVRGVDITLLDGSDAGLFRDWHTVQQVSQEHGRPYANVWTHDQVLSEVRAPTSRRRFLPYAGVVDGAVVSAGVLSLPMADNLTASNVTVDTRPELRGRGYGGAMLAHLEAVAASEGRTLADTEIPYPYDAPADGAGHPDVEFATRRGYAFGLGDVHRMLELPAPDGLLERLADDAAPHHTTYRVVAFAGPVPDEHLASYAVINASLMTEAPAGEIEREAESTDPALVREAEALQEAQGRTPYVALALDPQGEVAAYTKLLSSRQEPGKGYQWGTVVRRQDRGHRLGVAVKVANLRLLQAEEPDVERVFTYNAEVNVHMVAINDAVGFRPVERLGEFRKRL
ncbi:MAG: mshD 3 [Nocardioidaceae bacterium]|nr:mshD 3 [Nocardioidaceae bacterium]